MGFKAHGQQRKNLTKGIFCPVVQGYCWVSRDTSFSLVGILLLLWHVLLTCNNVSPPGHEVGWRGQRDSEQWSVQETSRVKVLVPLLRKQTPLLKSTAG